MNQIVSQACTMMAHSPLLMFTLFLFRIVDKWISQHLTSSMKHYVIVNFLVFIYLYSTVLCLLKSSFNMLVTWRFLVALFQGKLFEEIAEGLKRAKVVIVCASNEVCTILFRSLHYVL